MAPARVEARVGKVSQAMGTLPPMVLVAPRPLHRPSWPAGGGAGGERGAGAAAGRRDGAAELRPGPGGRAPGVVGGRGVRGGRIEGRPGPAAVVGPREVLGTAPGELGGPGGDAASSALPLVSAAEAGGAPWFPKRLSWPVSSTRCFAGWSPTETSPATSAGDIDGTSTTRCATRSTPCAPRGRTEHGRRSTSRRCASRRGRRWARWSRTMPRTWSISCRASPRRGCRAPTIAWPSRWPVAAWCCTACSTCWSGCLSPARRRCARSACPSAGRGPGSDARCTYLALLETLRSGTPAFPAGPPRDGQRPLWHRGRARGAPACHRAHTSPLGWPASRAGDRGAAPPQRPG